MTHPTDYPMPGTTYLTGTANTAEIQRKHGVVSPFSGRPKHIPARPWIQRLMIASTVPDAGHADAALDIPQFLKLER